MWTLFSSCFIFFSLDFSFVNAIISYYCDFQLCEVGILKGSSKEVSPQPELHTEKDGLFMTWIQTFYISWLLWIFLSSFFLLSVFLILFLSPLPIQKPCIKYVLFFIVVNLTFTFNSNLFGIVFFSLREYVIDNSVFFFLNLLLPLPPTILKVISGKTSNISGSSQWL